MDYYVELRCGEVSIQHTFNDITLEEFKEVFSTINPPEERGEEVPEKFTLRWFGDE